MTGHTYKPGDVALVEVGCWANRKVALRLAEGWAHVNGISLDDDGIVSPVRPIVVLDPEDREQVERLTATLFSEVGGDWPDGYTANEVQAALREYANPTPPKPEEPQGLGAVVESEDGRRWVRSKDITTVCHWKPAAGGRRVRWSDLPAVRVLSEGVQP